MFRTRVRAGPRPGACGRLHGARARVARPAPRGPARRLADAEGAIGGSHAQAPCERCGCARGVRLRWAMTPPPAPSERGGQNAMERAEATRHMYEALVAAPVEERGGAGRRVNCRASRRVSVGGRRARSSTPPPSDAQSVSTAAGAAVASARAGAPHHGSLTARDGPTGRVRPVDTVKVRGARARGATLWRERWRRRMCTCHPSACPTRCTARWASARRRSLVRPRRGAQPLTAADAFEVGKRALERRLRRQLLALKEQRGATVRHKAAAVARVWALQLPADSTAEVRPWLSEGRRAHAHPPRGRSRRSWPTCGTTPR